MRREEQFQNPLSTDWKVTEIGGGSVQQKAHGLDLTVPPTPQDQYADAQIADYDTQDYRFDWQPPVRLSVTAQANMRGDQLRGTAGFGFWNHPFSPDIKRLPRPPRAVWFFFASPPNDMQLAQGVPGHGWKAATIDAAHPTALAVAPLAPPTALLMNIPGVYQSLWGALQKVLRINEVLLDSSLLAERHTYTLDWLPDRVLFAVDGETVLEAVNPPQGQAGFIAWVDNQYAVATPQGKLAFGYVGVEQTQTLTLEHILIEHLTMDKDQQ